MEAPICIVNTLPILERDLRKLETGLPSVGATVSIDYGIRDP